MSSQVCNLDFETYSEAGLAWVPDKGRSGLGAWQGKGIAGVGAAAYAEHPSTEVLMLAYTLPGDSAPRLWLRGMASPADLFTHISAGGLLQGSNVAFERLIWEHVCVARMGWPPVALEQWRCSQAQSRAVGVPGKLATAADYLQVPVRKDKDGDRLIKKFACPRSPTLSNASRRVIMVDAPVDMAKFAAYCIDDVRAETAVSDTLPPLSDYELRLWLLDQEINARGVAIDQAGLAACIDVLGLAADGMNAELREITGGAVESADAVGALNAWLAGRGLVSSEGNLDADAVDELLTLASEGSSEHRALSIRSALGSKSTAKIYAMRDRLSGDGRLRDLFAYCGADRTGRWAGRGPQPQNLPKAKLPKGWSVGAALALLATRDLPLIRAQLGCPVEAIKACLRGLFVAAPDRDLICSDFSAIEAVVLAALAGEQWRLDVFATPGSDIYLESISRNTGTPVADYKAHAAATGEHHPHRQLGKIAELASGFGGGWGAWCRFGADQYMGEGEGKDRIKQWRQASPMIVALWYGLDRAARAAVRQPGVPQPVEQRTGYGKVLRTVPGLWYVLEGNVLWCRLPSGRRIAYRNPEVRPGKTPWGSATEDLYYDDYNTDSSKGPIGWRRLKSWYGLLTENIVQAVARDLQAAALLRLAAAGYDTVLHVHDEIVTEVAAGVGSVKEFERIMSVRPDWAADWPIKVGGGWRDKRYRKAA